MTTNPAQYITLQLSAFANAQTATELPISLDGSTSFSVDAWIKLGGLCANASILCKDGVFEFGVAGKALSLEIAGFPPMLSDAVANPLTEDEWRYVCVTYSNGQARIFIDGVFNVYQAISGTSQTSSNPFQIGHTLQGSARCVRVYNTALSPDQVMANMFGTPDASTIVADFDFTQNPPIDQGPSNLPISLEDGAKMVSKVPAVHFVGTAYAQPLLDEDINPGGLQTDPYTIQAWVYVELGAEGQQAIFVNSDLETDSGMAFYLVPDDTGLQYTINSQRGSSEQQANILSSSQKIKAGEWQNITTVFDGTDLSIWINGTQDTSAAFGPISTIQLQSNLLIGAALTHGVPSGSTSLRGYISRVDVWSRALDATEIEANMRVAPELDAPNLSAIYEFVSAPARNTVTSHPIGLADGAYLDDEITTLDASNSISDAAMEPDQEILQLDPEKLDILRDEARREILSNTSDDAFVHARTRELEALQTRLQGNDLSTAQAKIHSAWDKAEEVLRDDPLNMPFLVTRHKLDGEHIMLVHQRGESRVVFRAAESDFDDCTLWKVQLVFVIIGGVIDLLFGVRAQLTDKAIRYIIGKVLLNPRISSILALGSAMSAADIFEMGGTMYTLGMLKELAKLVVELGFWALLRVLAKLVITFLLPALEAADFIASLAATAITFIVTYATKPAACTPPPKIDLAGIKFNHSVNNSITSALNIRKNFTTQVDVPEWVRSEVNPAQSPAAYAIAQISGNTVSIQALFVSAGSNDDGQIQIRATDGGLLGAIDPVTITMKNGISNPEWVTLPLSHQTLSSAGVARTDISWTWQTSPVGETSWSTIQTTHHRIYTLLDVPTAPWNQTGYPNSPQAPWTDVLDYSCIWATGKTTKNDVNASITQKVNGSLGLSYEMSAGASAYAGKDVSIPVLTFLCSDFVDFLSGTGGNGSIVNCTDCATIVSTFANSLGSNLTESLMGDDFSLNKIIAIGGTTWGYPTFGPAFSYHEVAWNGGTGKGTPLYDACLEVNDSDNPWAFGGTPPPVALLPENMVFSTLPLSPAVPVPVPFTSPSYRERLCSNNAQGIGTCKPTGPRDYSNNGRRPVV